MTSPRSLFGRIGLAALALSLGSTSIAVAGDPAATIRRFIEAFNDHSPERMAKFIDEGFEMYFVHPDGASKLATEGRPALIEAVEAYFERLPTVRSEIEGPIVVGGYVAFRETAMWEHDGEPRRQSSLAVYEMNGDRILRVWYYPSAPE